MCMRAYIVYRSLLEEVAGESATTRNRGRIEGIIVPFSGEINALRQSSVW